MLEATFEIDHIQALAFKGNETVQNLQAICPACHRRKTMLERQRLADQRREEQTGVSKYFDAQCFSFLLHN